MEPPLETDEELVQQLQQEEVTAEEVWLGQDAATLEAVLEAAGPLILGQLEGLAGPSWVAGQSQLPAAAVVQLLVAVAT